jgi:gliding motility-associated-like protein
MYPLPIVNAGADIEDILGSTVTLGGAPTGPDGSTYFWSPNTNMLDASGETSSNPQIELKEELNYIVVVTDTNGCVNSDTIYVRPIPQIVFPNGFTPNGDGINDDWQIDYIDQFPNSVVEVYNRWGQMLFRSVGYTQRWDGRYNGEELPVGTYYYIIELNDPLFPDTYSGPITIMR